MEKTEGWSSYNDAGAQVEMTLAKGKKDKAIQVSYTLDPGGWVAIDKRDLKMDMSKSDKNQVFMYDDRNINTVEFKIFDATVLFSEKF